MCAKFIQTCFLEKVIIPLQRNMQAKCFSKLLARAVADSVSKVTQKEKEWHFYD